MDAKQLCLSGHKIIQFLFMGTLGIRMGRELAPRTDLWESTDSECLDQRQRQGEVSGGSWDPDPRFEMFTANQWHSAAHQVLIFGRCLEVLWKKNVQFTSFCPFFLSFSSGTAIIHAGKIPQSLFMILPTSLCSGGRPEHHTASWSAHHRTPHTIHKSGNVTTKVEMSPQGWKRHQEGGTGGSRSQGEAPYLPRLTKCCSRTVNTLPLHFGNRLPGLPHFFSFKISML